MVVSTLCREVLERPTDGTGEALVPGGLIVIGEDLVTQCMSCGAFKTIMGYVGGGPLVHRLGRYRVSHGVCPDCSDRILADYRREMQG